MSRFKIRREEKIETWWADYFEVEADSIEEAIQLIKSGDIDPEYSEPIDAFSIPLKTEYYDVDTNTQCYEENRR